jgi:KaiC domain protein
VSGDDDWFERAFADEPGSDPDAAAPGEGDDETTAATDATAGSPFDRDFSEAFDVAPEPGGDGGRAGVTSDPTDFDGGGDLFGDSGLGLPGAEFEEGGLDSTLERLDVGIAGLDEMILGGVPAQSLIAAIGSAGTGKTTVGMQFLNVALEAGDRAAFIALEESRQRVLDTADEKGWEFRRHEADGRLAVVDLNPVEMANSLGSLRNDLVRLVEEFDTERLVLDSVSLLEMMYDHPARRRSEVFQFTQALKRAGVTILVTSEASEGDPYASRHGIIEYLADAVFVLRYVRSNSFQETRLAIEIQKIRDANHSRQPKPYEITSEGISVHQQANLF